MWINNKFEFDNDWFNGEFNDYFNGVIGPEYAGARYPELDRFGINERQFAHEMRCKDFDISLKKGELVIKWCTQEPFKCVDRGNFDKEVVRCLEFLGYEGNIHVHLFDRDGYCDYKYVLVAKDEVPAW